MSQAEHESTTPHAHPGLSLRMPFCWPQEARTAPKNGRPVQATSPGLPSRGSRPCRPVTPGEERPAQTGQQLCGRQACSMRLRALFCVWRLHACPKALALGVRSSPDLVRDSRRHKGP